jgi:hypothetical protein
MTAQEAYEKIREWFDPSTRAFDDESLPKFGAEIRRQDGIVAVTCRYKAEDGSRCAVGCIIPDHLIDMVGRVTGSYSSLMDEVEERMVHDYGGQGRENDWAEVYEILDTDPAKRSFLSAAQRAHDQTAEEAAKRGSDQRTALELFIARLDLVAAKNGLEVVFD